MPIYNPKDQSLFINKFMLSTVITKYRLRLEAYHVRNLQGNKYEAKTHSCFSDFSNVFATFPHRKLPVCFLSSNTLFISYVSVLERGKSSSSRERALAI